MPRAYASALAHHQRDAIVRVPPADHRKGRQLEAEGEFGEETVDLPFTAEQFLGVFEQYNRAIWPLQVVAYVLGGTAILLTLRPRPYSDKIISGILVVLWLWTGLMYHALFFAPINPIATLFGAVFVGQAAIWAFAGVVQGRLRFRIGRDIRSVVGGALIVYAMVLYPLIGHLLGHGYLRSPSFGLTPCPLTIFTFGLLLWSRLRVPRYVLVIPVAWSIVGVTAAVSLGIVEDLGLLVAAFVSIALLSGPDRPPTPFGRWRREYAR
jgi:hypothetical protein